MESCDSGATDSLETLGWLRSWRSAKRVIPTTETPHCYRRHFAILAPSSHDLQHTLYYLTGSDCCHPRTRAGISPEAGCFAGSAPGGILDDVTDSTAKGQEGRLNATQQERFRPPASFTLCESSPASLNTRESLAHLHRYRLPLWYRTWPKATVVDAWAVAPQPRSRSVVRRRRTSHAALHM
jgi:hypothetical protein